MCGNWNKLQQVASNIVKLCPHNAHMINYEAMLHNKKKQLTSQTLVLQGISRKMAVTTIKENVKIRDTPQKKLDQSELPAKHSVLWKILTREESFNKKQLEKWHNQISGKQKVARWEKQASVHSNLKVTIPYPDNNPEKKLNAGKLDTLLISFLYLVWLLTLLCHLHCFLDFGVVF